MLTWDVAFWILERGCTDSLCIASQQIMNAVQCNGRTNRLRSLWRNVLIAALQPLPLVRRSKHDRNNPPSWCARARPSSARCSPPSPWAPPPPTSWRWSGAPSPAAGRPPPHCWGDRSHFGNTAYGISCVAKVMLIMNFVLCNVSFHCFWFGSVPEDSRTSGVIEHIYRLGEQWLFNSLTLSPLECLRLSKYQYTKVYSPLQPVTILVLILLDSEH